jgi:uracil-DNA glycosylase family 4
MKEGFFSKKETESKSRPNGKLLSCTSCGLYQNANTAKMKPYGDYQKGIMVIGDAPASKDDDAGIPWQGKSGKYLQRAFKSLGIDLFIDCISINSASCHPVNDNGNFRLPTNFEMDNCRRFVLAAIEKYKPKAMILLGASAVYSVIGHRWKKDLGGIEKWRGWAIPDQDFKTWICPTFHPSDILRAIENNKFGSDDIVDIVVWKKDLKAAFEKAKVSLPVYKEPVIDIIEDLSVLGDPKFGRSDYYVIPQTAFDYETTGLKPHAEGHRIVCAAIADSQDHAYAFMMPEDKAFRKPFLKYLGNQGIAKIAQNMKFEHTWSKVRLNKTVKGWAWDTMLASHILDNRTGVTGLKFQTYVQFGIVNYDSEVSPYLAPEKSVSANDINQIDKLLAIPGGKEKLLTYCGYDAVYEYRLAMLQRKIMEPKLGGNI